MGRSSAFRRIPLSAIGEPERTAWRELAERAIEPNPFWDPDFVLPVARGLGAVDEVSVVCEVSGSDWLSALPVRTYPRWNRVPGPWVASWRHPYCLLGTPLIAADRDQGDFEALIGAMRATHRGSLIAGADWISAEVVGSDAEEAPPGGVPIERFSRATLKRRPQPDYLEGRVRGKHRREFRRLAKGLEEELGADLELVDRSAEEAGLETFLALEASGWKGRAGTALACDAGHAEFFRESSRALAARGALELLFLESGGKAVAARCSYLAGGASFCFKLAFDETLSRFSPGRELELRLIDRFHEAGELEWMDSCAQPTNQVFNRLWPDRRELVSCAYPVGGPFGRAARAALVGAVNYRDRRRARRKDQESRARTEE